METDLQHDQCTSEEESTISFPPLSQTIPINNDKPQLSVGVIFRKVEETYPVDRDLEVFYTVFKGVEVTSRDWIGLYKVGWRSHHDYVYYDWSPPHETSHDGKDVDKKIVFSGSKMPKEDGDFYQFCYVTSTGQVRGASTPFQFKESQIDDLVIVREGLDGTEDEDLMIVKTSKELLHEQMIKTKLENISINEKLLSVETSLELALARELGLKMDLDKMMEAEDSIKKLNEEHMDQLTEARQQNEYLQGCMTGMQEKVDILNQEKTSMERRLDDSDGYISSLQDKIKNLVVEKDLLQGKLNSQLEENTVFKNYSKQLMLECEEKVRKLQGHDADTAVRLAKLTDELKNMKTSMAFLSDKLQNSEDKLGAAEHCKKMLNEEVVALKDKLEALEADTEMEKKKIAEENEKKAKELEIKRAEVVERDKQLEAINEQLREYDRRLRGNLVEKVKQHLEDLKNKLVHKEDLLEERRKEVDEERRAKEALAQELQASQGCMFALETAHKVLLQRLNNKQDSHRNHNEKLRLKKEKERKQEDENNKDVEQKTTSELKEKLTFYMKMYSEERELNTKLTSIVAEQERQLIDLKQKCLQGTPTFQTQPEPIRHQPVHTNEEERHELTSTRFVDALNDYSLAEEAGCHDVIGDEAPDEEVLQGRVDALPCRSIKSCPFCPLTFDEGMSEVAMTQHVEIHMKDGEEDEPTCPVCGVQLQGKPELSLHIESHFE